MKRIIKFRAWHDEKGVMGSAYPLDVLLMDATSRKAEQIGEDFKHMTIMQFTNFRDHKGREIYEGDLLRHIPNGMEPRLIFQVQWNGTEGRFQAWNKFSFFSLDIHVVEGYEVIGDIYQNPELAK